MSTRKEMITEFYDRSDENGRLEKSRHGQLEYAITMAYIHRYLNPGARVLEVGAGTGRYSIALAKEGFDVTAVEFVESNLAALRENSCGLDLIRSYQGDATDLCLFDDGSFDMTLVLGPMYHLFAPEDVNRAIDEAIRVTKPGGTLHFAFLSIYALMYSNALYGSWAPYQEENFTKDFKVRHFQEQLFTGYDVCEFERLFDEKPVERVTTVRWRRWRNVRISLFRTRILMRLLSGILRLPKSGSFWAGPTICCISAKRRSDNDA